MRRGTGLLAVSVAALLIVGGLVGCDVPTPAKRAGSPKGPPPPPPLPNVPQSPPPTAGANQPLPTASSKPVTPSPTAPAEQPRAPIAPTPSAPAPAIQLSTGVALPQTGPTGILMSFSVDYRFSGGEPQASGGYVWVIERGRGEPARVPVRLGRRGNLPILIPGWRPEQGPFRSHIEDANGNRVSPTISLR